VSGSEWLIDPVLVDCAFQLAILWARHQSGRTVLPTGFVDFWRYALSPRLPVRCEFQAQGNNGSPVVEARIAFLDETEKLLWLVEGAEFSGSSELNRLSSNPIGVPVG